MNLPRRRSSVTARARRPLLLAAASALRYVARGVVLVIAVRRFGSGPAGDYALALAATAPGFIFLDLGLRDVALSLHRRIRASRYIAVRAGASGFVLLGSLVVCAAVAPSLVLLVGAVGLQKVADSFGDLRSGLLQIEGRVGAIPVLAAATTAGQLLVLTVAVGAGATLAQAIGTAALGALLVVALSLASLGRSAHDRSAPDRASLRASGAVPPAPQWSSTTLRTRARIAAADARLLLRAGLPTGVSSGLVTLLSAVPQYVLAARAPASEVSVLSVQLYLVIVIQVVSSALAQTWVPRARRLAMAGRLDVASALRAASAWSRVTAGLSLAVLGVGAAALPRVFSGAYAVGPGDALAILLTGMAIPFGLAAATALSSLNRYATSATVSAVALAGATALSLALVPWAGRTGALWAYALTVVIRATAGLVGVRRETTPCARPAGAR